MGILNSYLILSKRYVPIQFNTQHIKQLKQIFFKIYIIFYVVVLQQQNNRLSALSLRYDVSFHNTGNQTQASQSNFLLQEWQKNIQT